MAKVRSEEAQLLLHNKFVVILGDSIQRTVYKDLVLFLQSDNYLTNSQLRSKGEPSFEGDQLVEGGTLSNSTVYREARQLRSPSHLLRFYFLTRVYSNYVESVLADFQGGLQPDVLIVNSCVWDISRYGSSSLQQYRENLGKFFSRLNKVLLPECLVIWNMTMPLGEKIKGGFLIPELQYLDATLRCDVIEANFYSAVLADAHGFDVLDLHYGFRFQLQHRAADGIHWNKVVHRSITILLLEHIADAWGVALSHRGVQASVPVGVMTRGLPASVSGVAAPFSQRRSSESRNSNAVETDFIRDCTESRWGNHCPGYTSFNSNATLNAAFEWYGGDLVRRHVGRFRSVAQTTRPGAHETNNLVMRRRLLHSRIPAPYGQPHYRLGHC